jgi:glycosyltransferase involved in cell wall biosynthesis
MSKAESQASSDARPAGIDVVANKPYVVYWNNIPSPYMVERFNAVAERGNLDFEAWFSERLNPERSWDIDEVSWSFRYRYLRGVPLTGGRLKLPGFIRRRPDLVISLYSEPSFIIGWALARMSRIPIAFWCEITFDSWVPRRRWKEHLKHFMFRRVEATLGAGDQGKAYAGKYGTPLERTLVLPHVIDVQQFARASRRTDEEIEHHRRELGLSGTTFIYVGRLWKGKGLDYLLDAFETLPQATDAPMSLLLMGDGPEEERLKQRCTQRGIKNVIFAGFVQKEELPSYYALADVFVFPTLGDPYGLVVDEAMACRLPIISTTAAGEIAARVDDGRNGFVVPPGDSDALRDRMQTLGADEALRRRMGEASSKKVEGKTPEFWAESFEDMVKNILSMPRAQPRPKRRATER